MDILIAAGSALVAALLVLAMALLRVASRADAARRGNPAHEPVAAPLEQTAQQAEPQRRFARQRPRSRAASRR